MPQNPPADVVEALDMLQAAVDALRSSLTDPEPSSAVRAVCLKEAARLLGMSDRTVRRRAQALGGVKAGGSWRFDPEMLKRR